MTVTQPVSVYGSVDLSMGTINQLQCHATPCTAHALGGGLQAIYDALGEQTTGLHEELQQVGKAVAALLAAPEACRAAERYRWGLHAAATGRWEAAAEEFEASVGHHRFEPRAHLALAYALAETGREEDARNALREAAREGATTDPEVGARAVLELVERIEGDDPAQALSEARLATASYPNCVELLAVCARLGDEDQRAALLQHAPNWTVLSSGLEVDEQSLPRDPDAVAQRLSDVEQTFRALGIEPEIAQRADWDGTGLARLANELRAKLERAGSSTEDQDAFASAEQVVQVATTRLEELRATKVGLRERRAHKDETARASAEVTDAMEEASRLRGIVDERKAAFPRAREATDALEQLPLCADRPCLSPVSKGITNLQPRAFL